MEWHIVLTSPFFACQSSLLQWIKLCASTSCHSATQMPKKDFMSRFRWSWGGIPASHLIFLSNLSFYVGCLLSPKGGSHILIRSLLGLQFIFASPCPVCSSSASCGFCFFVRGSQSLFLVRTSHTYQPLTPHTRTHIPLILCHLFIL